MNTPQRIAGMVLLLNLLSLGCESEPAGRQANQRKDQARPDPSRTATARDDGKRPIEPSVTTKPDQVVKSGPAETTRLVEPVASKEQPSAPPNLGDWERKKLGEQLWLETQGEKKEKRRVLVGAVVCLRKGNYGLECLLCRKGTKEHESILVTPADARMIHGALQVCGAVPGAPVQYEPKFESPRGQPIKITAAFDKNGKLIIMPAQRWITNQKTKKELEHHWVFAGSKLYKNLDDVDLPPHYAANADGGYICLSNVPSAMLDLPINSPKAIDDRIFEPNTDHIPPLDTYVTLILEVDKK